jgi:hypothetical protein
VQWAEDAADCTHGRLTDLIVSPFGFSMVSAMKDLKINVVIEDLQVTFDANRQKEIEHPYVDFATSENEFFEAYRDIDEIEDYFDSLCSTHSNVCTKFSIGTSYEGRNIFAYRMTRGSNPGKVKVLYNGWIHPREWIAGTTLQYTMDWLIRGANGTNILDDAITEIIPILNPDGYVHTRTEDNLWRKSRKPNTPNPCIGTDLNRNWQFEWATVGSSNNPCDDTYHGTIYFDNPETKAISDYMKANPDMVSHIDWHAYSRFVMYPWGCYTTRPPHYSLFQDIGADMVAAIQSYRGTRYTHGSIEEIIYAAAGSSADYVYGQLERTFALAYEIGNAFQPPTSEIIPTGEEILRATIAHITYVIDYHETNKIAQ